MTISSVKCKSIWFTRKNFQNYNQVLEAVWYVVLSYIYSDLFSNCHFFRRVFDHFTVIKFLLKCDILCILSMFSKAHHQDRWKNWSLQGSWTKALCWHHRHCCAQQSCTGRHEWTKCNILSRQMYLYLKKVISQDITQFSWKVLLLDTLKLPFMFTITSYLEIYM